ncbi:MAG: helix-turn-helix transcriptional regulator [Nocardioidaceae bacterium]
MDPAGAARDDLLAQPTRAGLWALLRELRRPAGTEELADRLGLHPNGVRVHLGRMLAAGLVVRRSAPQPRGRPRAEWSLASQAASGGTGVRAYDDLARWLARAIPPEPARLRDVERAGRRIGRELAPSGAAPPEPALHDTLTELGFEPLVERRPSGRLSCRLGNCPYRDPVVENQPVVCTLHRGITRGLLDVLAPAARLARFVPHDPDAAGCEIDVDGLPAA